MSNKPLSFRFPDEFVKLLRTWAFVTETDQRALLQEAFQEYAERRPEIKEKVDAVMSTLD
ncbi:MULTISPECIES: hypothetical protein [Paenibacillus]|jgi:predicted transcriptional regulator|uniref:hypothetical protein n=1 Tax=Paenibacillus TaxID=44249 RepID=UPI00119F290E|nr:MULTISPECIES: hypothetical protein [Paenibacillus]MCI1777170.1 hypothetical protein [Paenibacillus lautus]